MITRLICIIVGCLWAASIFAQDRYKPSPTEIATLPLWAQKMYGNSPNVWEIDQLYQTYYKTHSFTKNYHTQYYKKWRKQIGNTIDDHGFPFELDIRNKIDRMTAFHNNQNRSGNWSVLGPFITRKSNGDTVAQQANIYCVDQATTNSAIWYCGTETGEVYRSNNMGQNWTNISLQQVFDGGIRAIEIDPSDENIVYAASGDFILKTTDGGQNWVISLAISGLAANEILVVSTSPNIVVATSDKGLYRSIDGGLNWNAVYPDRCYDIKSNTANSNILYLVKHNSTQNLCEFFRSTDAGQTFTQQTNGWHTSNDAGRNDGGARLAVSPADSNRVYAYLIGESKTGDTGFIGVYRSNDGGTTWTLPNGPAGGPYTTGHQNLAIGSPSWQYHQGYYNCAIMASPSNPDHILVGGLNLYKSDDGGLTFTPLAGYVGGNYSIHVDMQDFRVVGNSTIISTDGGIYHSNDFFATNNFSVRMNGIHAAEYWGFGQGWNTDVFVGGLYHNGNIAYHENYGNGNFLQLGGGEPASGYVNPGENRKVYSSDINGKILPLAIGDPIPSIGFGINPNESYWIAESSELEFLPSCHNIAFTGFENDLWRTEDGCNTFVKWKEFGTDDDDKITYLEISRSNPDVMYVCQQERSPNNGIIWKTTNGGQTWSSLTLPNIGGNNRKILLQLDPTNENHLWIAFKDGQNGTKVYRTTNGGTSWINLTTSDLNGASIHSLVLIPNTGGDIYAFTQKGVWYRNNNSSNWTDCSAGLPIEINTNIAKPFYRDGKLRLASYGRGVWESSLQNQPTTPIAQIGVDKLAFTQHCTKDTFYFVDQSIINHQGASWSWEFINGSPSTSSSLYPAVVYNTPGVHLVKLTVTDGNGNSDIDSLYIDIIPYQAQTFVSEDFEGSFPPNQFEIYNPDNSKTWQQTTNAGGHGLSMQATWVDNFNYNPAGKEDDLSVSVDFSTPSDPWLTFDVAYARYAVNYSDSLEVLVSTDCGATIQSVYFKGGTTLATVPDTNGIFVPSAQQWRTDSVNLSSYAGTAEIMLIFRNHSGYGNSLFLDNINLAQQIISSAPAKLNVQDFNVYPNPVASGGTLHCISSSPSDFTLYDISGKKIMEKTNIENTVSLPSLTAGTYFYTLFNRKIWKRGKLIVQ